VILRCKLDGLLLPGQVDVERAALVAYDCDEAFVMDRIEIMYYELVSASPEELQLLQRARYRLLQFAQDFSPATGASS
jgi:hypothetical protein